MSDLTLSTDLMRPLPGALTVNRPAGGANAAQMRRTAEDFEASFLSQMLKPMFEGLRTDGPFGGGEGEATWRSFMVEAMAKQTVRAGGIGLADRVMTEMLRMQEAEAPVAPPPGSTT